jgi:soluble cytochrome b562
MAIDPELKEMLDKVESVKSCRAFNRWRSSFLAKFESVPEQAKIDKAQAAYKAFSESMKAFVKQVSTLNNFVDKGDISEEKSTVKARNSLNEMSKMMTALIRELDDLIPSTGADEKKRGYKKIHTGVVLIRDDFAEYSRLSVCGDTLKHMREVSLNAVADKQILEQMDNYGAKLQKFCDVMADLGLSQVMLKCIQYVNETEDAFEDIIFIDVKTGGIGMLSRADCLANKVLKEDTKDADGNDLFSEAVFEEEAKGEIIQMIMESPKLGLGFEQYCRSRLTEKGSVSI